MQPFINVPYPMVEQNIPRIKELGIGIEIYINNNIADETRPAEGRRLGDRLRDLAIPCTVHAPFMDLSPGGFDRKVRSLTRDSLVKAAELAAALKARNMVCHPGYDRWRFAGHHELWLEGSVETWRKVLDAAGDGTQILLENVFEEEPETLVALFEAVRRERLGFCFDTGHFNLFSTVSLDQWLRPLRDSLRELHLHDNSGTADDHLPIGKGTFPFRDLKVWLGDTLHRLTPVTEMHGETHAREGLRNLKEFLS